MQIMSDMADGEVREIDKDAKKITLRHGELKQLDMPPMTMVFQVKDRGRHGSRSDQVIRGPVCGRQPR
jgi:Cu/Ag efflux protein CusF